MSNLSKLCVTPVQKPNILIEILFLAYIPGNPAPPPFICFII